MAILNKEQSKLRTLKAIYHRKKSKDDMCVTFIGETTIVFNPNHYDQMYFLMRACVLDFSNNNTNVRGALEKIRWWLPLNINILYIQYVCSFDVVFTIVKGLLLSTHIKFAYAYIGI